MHQTGGDRKEMLAVLPIGVMTAQLMIASLAISVGARVSDASGRLICCRISLAATRRRSS
jgi:hypothetical protein